MKTGEGHGDGFIAVIGQWRSGYLRFPLTYAHAIRSAGGEAKVLSTFDPAPGDEITQDYELLTGLDPLDPSVLDGAQGLVMPGGGDIDPAWYGCERHPRTHNVNHRRDRFELTLLEEALARDIPVLAICHGMQLLNVHFGGTLDQHLADDPRRLDHDRDRPRAEPAHSIRIEPGTLLEEILGKDPQVNSHHHQGLQRVADELVEVAWAEDGVLEAVVVPSHAWVVGVQWHPEAMAPVDQGERALFEAFVDATRGVATAESSSEIRASA
jgi:gamma-glutamyl-gamma-aminobutyrate hydrolase PuuD